MSLRDQDPPKPPKDPAAKPKLKSVIAPSAAADQVPVAKDTQDLAPASSEEGIPWIYQHPAPKDDPANNVHCISVYKTPAGHQRYHRDHLRREETRVATLQSQLKTEEIELQHLQARVVTLQNQSFRANSDANQRKFLSESLSSKWKEHSKQLQACEETLRKSADQVTHWQYHTGIVKAELDKATENFHGAAKFAQDLSSQLTHLQKDITRLQEEAKAKEQSIESARQEIAKRQR